MKAERRLLTTIIGELPEQFERNRLELLSTISGALETTLTDARPAALPTVEFTIGTGGA